MARTTDPFGAQLAQELASSSDQGAVGVLLADYARYHLALVVVGGFSYLGLCWLMQVGEVEDVLGGVKRKLRRSTAGPA